MRVFFFKNHRYNPCLLFPGEGGVLTEAAEWRVTGEKSHKKLYDSCFSVQAARCLPLPAPPLDGVARGRSGRHKTKRPQNILQYFNYSFTAAPLRVHLSDRNTKTRYTRHDYKNCLKMLRQMTNETPLKFLQILLYNVFVRHSVFWLDYSKLILFTVLHNLLFKNLFAIFHTGIEFIGRVLLKFRQLD